MTIYPTVLYIKQHSVTGLKYFGKTTAKDPYKYKGSGTDWKLHLKEYGSEHIITTHVFGPFTDSIVISEFALAFSRDNHIVESKDWANLKEENGLDGVVAGTKRGPHSEETKQKISDANKGKPLSAETKQKMSDAKKGKPRSDETKQKMSDAMKGKPKSTETKQKISDTKTGQTHSTETKQKISDAKKGKPRSAETNRSDTCCLI
jgi:hypothetical protein